MHLTLHLGLPNHNSGSKWKVTRLCYQQTRSSKCTPQCRIKNRRHFSILSCAAPSFGALTLESLVTNLRLKTTRAALYSLRQMKLGPTSQPCSLILTPLKEAPLTGGSLPLQMRIRSSATILTARLAAWFIENW